MTFFSFSLENRIWHFMQIVPAGEKYFKMLSAEIFTQSAKPVA